MMGFYSVWPPFVCVVLLFGLAATPLLSFADSPPSDTTNRMASLDGLRGFLALAVVFHHVSIYYGYLTTGVWTFPPTRFYQFLGPLGVSGFFMITGFLFWGRLIRNRGQAQWRAFYIGRLFRIAPLYFVAVGTMLVLVFTRLHFDLLVPKIKVAKELTRWLSIGIFTGVTADGSERASNLLAGVVWTIHWEWMFYFSLPFLAFAARSKRFRTPVVVLIYGACLVCALLPMQDWWSHRFERLIALFLMGMFSASIRAERETRRLPDIAASILIVTLVAGVFLLQDPYSFKAGLLLGGGFYLVTSGCTVFGLLVSRPARRLGDISYGIYLLQGLALAATFSTAAVRAFAVRSPIDFWLSGLGACILLLILATIAHVLIERPGIAWGRRVAYGKGPGGVLQESSVVPR